MPSTPDGAGPPDGASVVAAVRAAAGPDGFVPFDRVVEVALYDPRVGYYARPGRRLGVRGDFYTSAHASPLYGAALARRARTEYERLGGPTPFRVVELGPGDGTLAADFLRAVPGELPPGAVVEFVFVERSEALAEAVGRALAPLDVPGRVEVRRAGSLGGDGPFSGFVFANELLDAVPFRRLIARDGAWKELGVRWDGARFKWAEDRARPLPPPPLPRPPRDGAVLEVSPYAEAILREVGDHLVRGAAVFVDYGREEADLLTGAPEGTLAAVRAHRALADPLADLGEADLSAFVNFTRIRAAAGRSGLAETAYVGQAEALARWGIGELIEARAASAGSAEEEVRHRLAAKNLLFGFAEFRVLELRPAAEPPEPTS